MTSYKTPDIKINYEEREVPPYDLPDPLVDEKGTAVNQTSWPHRRREILKLFETHVYGRMPKMPFEENITVNAEIVEEGPCSDWATRQQVVITFANETYCQKAHLLIYLPMTNQHSAPVFAGLNFFGNQTVLADDKIHITEKWVRNSRSLGITNHRANNQTRGTYAHRWQIEHVIKRGYGLATIYCGDFDPDFDDGYNNGIHPLFYQENQVSPKPNEIGAIGAWAWGLSRIFDYLANDSKIDASRIGLIGHSRLGKTALWAGATDERFSFVISNNSGCGGAALSRRCFGENIKFINTHFPHWFCENFREYNNREEMLPVDQHMLIALLAPRPVYIASAEEDLWADPVGEFLSCVNADPVYQLLCSQGLSNLDMPSIESPLHGRISYHIRSGKHDLSRYDWDRYLEFTDRQVAG